MLEVEKQSFAFEVSILRPGGILPKDILIARRVLPVLVPVVSVCELAHGMVAAALGQSSKKLLQNDDIVELARKANAVNAKFETNEAAR